MAIPLILVLSTYPIYQEGQHTSAHEHEKCKNSKPNQNYAQKRLAWPLTALFTSVGNAVRLKPVNQLDLEHISPRRPEILLWASERSHVGSQQ